MKIYRAKAPLRLSFCGGGTDVSPYPEERGGAVLSTTLDKFAYASLKPRKDDRLRIRSLDYYTLFAFAFNITQIDAS